MTLHEIKQLLEKQIEECANVIINGFDDENNTLKTIKAYQYALLLDKNINSSGEMSDLLFGADKKKQQESYLKLISHVYELSGKSKGNKELEGWYINEWLAYCIGYLFEILVYLKLREKKPTSAYFSTKKFFLIEKKNPAIYILDELSIAAKALYYYGKMNSVIENKIDTAQASKELAEDIIKIATGEQICFPLCWHSKEKINLLPSTKRLASAHAVYINFSRKNTDTFEILIDNLGLGCSEKNTSGKYYYPEETMLPNSRYPFFAEIKESKLVLYLKLCLDNLIYTKELNKLTGKNSYDLSSQKRLYETDLIISKIQDIQDLFKKFGLPNEEQSVGNCVFKNYFVGMLRRIHQYFIKEDIKLPNQTGHEDQLSLLKITDNLLENILLNMQMSMILSLSNNTSIDFDMSKGVIKGVLSIIYENFLIVELGKQAVTNEAQHKTKILTSINAIGLSEEISGKDNKKTYNFTLEKFISDIKYTCYIQAEAGRGKSTLLRFLFKELLFKQDKMPFYIRLKDIVDTPMSLEEAVYEYVFRSYFPEIIVRKSEFIQYIKQILSKKNMVFLLDGLDEIYFNYPNWLKELLVNSEYTIVITSKKSLPLSLQPKNTEKLRQLDLRGLTEEGIHNYVSQFFSDDPSKTSQVLEKVNNLKLGVFASNPLLLNILCFIGEKLNFEMTSKVGERSRPFFY